jgi:hypothetical protein
MINKAGGGGAVAYICLVSDMPKDWEMLLRLDYSSFGVIKALAK